jgi:hypothetical protein
MLLVIVFVSVELHIQHVSNILERVIVSLRFKNRFIQGPICVFQSRKYPLERKLMEWRKS